MKKQYEERALNVYVLQEKIVRFFTIDNPYAHEYSFIQKKTGVKI